MTSLALLFVVSFGAATILPFYSEILFAALYEQGHDPLALWSIATLGNTLGSVVNWWLGRYCLHFRDRRWFPFKEKRLGMAQRWFQRYGVWSLLLAWAPVGGDALTFVAGLLGTRLPVFLALVAIGKGVRYAAVLLIVANVSFG